VELNSMWAIHLYTVGVVLRGVFYGVYFRVFRLYMVSIVCIIYFTGFCSSWAWIWFLNKICR